MGSDYALSLLSEMLWNAVIVTAPILGAILLVGVVISILQVATQIQEMTLTYIPKLLVAAVLLIFLGSWMIGRITQFAQGLFLAIPGLAH